MARQLTPDVSTYWRGLLGWLGLQPAVWKGHLTVFALLGKSASGYR